MFRKQGLCGWVQWLVMGGLTVAMSVAQDKPIGKPMFIVRSGEATFADAAVTAASTTIPHWSSTFTAKGKKYSYSMVGTNPFTSPGSASTVNTELQPITFKFANGVTISGLERRWQRPQAIGYRHQSRSRPDEGRVQRPAVVLDAANEVGHPSPVDEGRRSLEQGEAKTARGRVDGEHPRRSVSRHSASGDAPSSRSATLPRIAFKAMIR